LAASAPPSPSSRMRRRFVAPSVSFAHIDLSGSHNRAAVWVYARALGDLPGWPARGTRIVGYALPRVTCVVWAAPEASR
jgi:hypothetical protein